MATIAQPVLRSGTSELEVCSVGSRFAKSRWARLHDDDVVSMGRFDFLLSHFVVSFANYCRSLQLHVHF
jgi:hypothetical protein